jgi:carbonic anhydrase/acetyltransferase-like protein (isoleucine patch superfamily)
MRHTAVEIDDARPQVHGEAWVAPTAVLAGRVTLAAQAGVWY